MKKLISLIDLETTGLDPRTAEIIEMAVIVFDAGTLEIVDSYETKVKPEHIETASEKALMINGYNEEEWKDAVSLQTAMTSLFLYVSGTQLLAQNVIFDYGFLEAAEHQTGIKLNFIRPCLDLPSIAWGIIPHDKLQSWSLKTLCAYLRIPPEPAIHRAMNGAQSAFEVYKKLMV